MGDHGRRCDCDRRLDGALGVICRSTSFAWSAHEGRGREGSGSCVMDDRAIRRTRTGWMIETTVHRDFSIGA